jgi:hypothetical protein
MENIRDTDARTVFIYATFGGKFKVRLHDPNAERGNRWGSVIDNDGEVIGSANDSTYAGRHWCISTVPYAGCADLDQVEIVE